MLSRPREMVLHNRLFIFIGFVIISLATGWAGEEPVNKDRTVRYPDKERLEHYRLDRQFQYKEVNIQEISLFRSLLYWVEQKLIDLKQELFNLRFQHEVGQIENPKKIKQTKNDIARLKTIIRESQLQNRG